MLKSLRSRLTAILALSIVASLTSGALMIGLFQQSASAKIGQAQAMLGRSCDMIANTFRFYSAGWPGPQSGLGDPDLRRDLTTVVQTALRDQPGVEGGIWQKEAGPLAYAFPTYEGSGPKTDLPEAERPRITAINEAVMLQDREQASRFDAGSQTLLLAACPLMGPIQGLTAWSMTRVQPFAGQGYQQLMAGLAVLLAAVLAAAALSIRLTLTWSRHVSRIETALNAHDISELPVLPKTGERELDRIVLALNETGERLASARRRAEQLLRQVATGERLTAIGRVSAGFAHEIRNPIAAMRLRVETAMTRKPEQQGEVLPVVLEQVDRLDLLLRRLLHVTERDEPRFQNVALRAFLKSCGDAYDELAKSKGVTIGYGASVNEGCFDADQMRRALDNLILNAIQAAPSDTRIEVAARREGDVLLLSVSDQGAGPPADICGQLFEPFVTGRSDGTGLGLSIVREVAEAHGGTARLVAKSPGTTFEIAIPWQRS